MDVTIADHPGMAHHGLATMGIDDETLRMIALPIKTSSYPNSLTSPSTSVSLSIMRVSKPSSPRRKLCRRMTFNSGDVNQRFASLQQPHLQTQQQYWAPPKKCSSSSRRHHPEVTSNRPVSWHAPSFMQTRLPLENSQASPAPLSEIYPLQTLQFPSTLSGYFTSPISPGSTSSPELLSINESESTNYYCPDPAIPSNFYASDSTFLGDQSWPLESLSQNSCFYPDQLQSPFGREDAFSYFHFNWDTHQPRPIEKNLIALPPTPHDTLPYLSNHAACLPDDTSLNYDQTEEDDEVLVGMGLYDHPDSSKSSFSPAFDPFYPHLIPELSVPKSAHAESQGRGLKLEERFTPPESEDDDDDEDDDDENVDAQEESETNNVIC